MRIDAHHHVWRLARGDYHWLTPGSAIGRDFGLDDLRPQLGEISATVLVQAAPTVAETRFLLGVARGSAGLVQAVVGWADLTVPDQVQGLTPDPLLRGLRPMLQDIAETGWIARDDVAPGLAAMERAGLRLDLLVQPRHLPLLPALAQRHPMLPLVIDHAAKPGIARGEWQPWADDIRRAAQETPAFCKLSGLVTEAGTGWTVTQLRPYVDHLLACFGPARLMWGSDWPVVTLRAEYQNWRNATAALLDGLTAPERDDVLGGAATRFYGIT